MVRFAVSDLRAYFAMARGGTRGEGEGVLQGLFVRLNTPGDCVVGGTWDPADEVGLWELVVISFSCSSREAELTLEGTSNCSMATINQSINQSISQQVLRCVFNMSVVAVSIRL